MLTGSEEAIAVIPAGGGKPEVILDSGINFIGGWSPDDSKVLYSGFVDGAWNLYWVDRASRKVQRLTNYTRMRSYLSYPNQSRDGKRMVYEYNETKGNVYLAELK